MGNIQQLIKEHEVIQSMLCLLEKLCDRLGQEEDVEIKHLEQLVEFIQIYIGQNHHAKEEVILFPALERSGVPREGGPICVMLMEHHMGKEYLVGMKGALEVYKNGVEKGMAQFVEHARNYISLLHRHIDKENQCLYPLAEQRLDPELLSGLEADFERLEIVTIGRGTAQKFESFIKELGEMYDVSEYRH